MKKKSGLSDWKNIGPTIEKRLNEIGVYNRQDLKSRRRRGLQEDQGEISKQDDPRLLLPLLV
jgi:predicted flap endonuclease-1-like 5' DNA nuclease